MSTTKRLRSHKNTTRLTAKERAKVLGIRWNPLAWKGLADDIERALQAHAREAVARAIRRYRAKHPTPDDIRAAIEPVMSVNWKSK